MNNNSRMVKSFIRFLCKHKLYLEYRFLLDPNWDIYEKSETSFIIAAFNWCEAESKLEKFVDWGELHREWLVYAKREIYELGV